MHDADVGDMTNGFFYWLTWTASALPVGVVAKCCKAGLVIAASYGPHCHGIPCRATVST